MAGSRTVFFRDSRFNIALKQLAIFQRDVEKDATKFNVGTLIRLRNEFLAIGRDQFRAMGTEYLNNVAMPNAARQFQEIIGSLTLRFAGLWQQNVVRSFATAEDSVVGKGFKGRTILQRLFEFFRDSPEAEIPEKLKPNLSAIVRTKRVVGQKRRVFRVGLVQHIKLLTKTMPMNFFREADSILLKFVSREARVPRNKQLFRVSNPGVVPESAQTCIFTQGRVLTADALMFVQRNLSPNLFHPNCRHHILRGFKKTLDTYDGEFGPVLTLDDVKKFVAHPKIRNRARPNPHAIPV